MHIACGTVNFRRFPLEDALVRIARAGYEYVETQATAPFCPHVDPWRDDPDAFRRRVADLGFKGCTALWAPNGAIIPDGEAVTGVTQALEWAAAAGIPVVNAGDGAAPEGMSTDRALSVMSERLAEILETAARCRVYVALEPHGTFSLTPEGLQRLLGLSDSPWLAVNYDPANVHRAGYVETRAGDSWWQPFGATQDEVATLRGVVGRVVHFHAKDIRAGECVALGEGEVDLPGCVAVLREAGYRGALSLETEGELDPEAQQVLVERSRPYLEALVSGAQGRAQTV
jgi:sugar phosphate isomerase/epimerase